jgi:hypothetical protein
VITQNLNGPDPASFDDKSRDMIRGTLLSLVLVFFGSYLLLFFGMRRRPVVFDEGLVLTAAMRIAANQIPHRDFFVLYGPAQFYILAGLFRMFGESLLVERLFDLFTKALLVTSVYAITSAYCRRPIAACTSLAALLWVFSLNQWAGAPLIPVSVLNLVGSALILPVFAGSASRWRMCAAGGIAGLASLFRYDTGVALLLVHTCVVAFAVYPQCSGIWNRLRAFRSLLWPYLLGFALVVAVPAFSYLSAAPAHFLVNDVVGYSSKYYYRGRNLPYPAIGIHTVENLALYLPIAIAALALYVFLTQYFRTGRQQNANTPPWVGFLFTFGLLTVAMYLKGFVRVSLVQMYLAIVTSILLVAVLWQNRSRVRGPFPMFIGCLTALSVLAVAAAAFREGRNAYLAQVTVPEYIWSRAHGVVPREQTVWCSSKNPLTIGFCFLSETDRVRVIEYISSHTTPDQFIYVGLRQHTKIFANDNLIYFATQRLPATRWSELDPDLESRYDVQTEMVHEFETKPVPFIVLDSEFESINEPNDSSKSSGVTLLDDYIRSKYDQVESFGVMSVWKKKSAS